MKKKTLTEDQIKSRYCSQKLRDLRDFGYDTLTLDAVHDQYDKVVAKSTDLNVIGRFIKADFDRLEDK